MWGGVGDIEVETGKVVRCVGACVGVPTVSALSVRKEYSLFHGSWDTRSYI